MPAHVTAHDPVPVPASPGSPLVDLRKRREEKRDSLHLDLEVPRWDEDGGPFQVWVRYKPARHSLAVTSAEKRQKTNDPDWVTLANADSLVDACVGVYVKVKGQPFTLSGGQWVSFDRETAGPEEWVSVTGGRVEELNEALGVQAHSAVETLRALFFTDGDLVLHALKLGQFSAVSAPEADEETLGK